VKKLTFCKKKGKLNFLQLIKNFNLFLKNLSFQRVTKPSYFHHLV